MLLLPSWQRPFSSELRGLHTQRHTHTVNVHGITQQRGSDDSLYDEPDTDSHMWYLEHWIANWIKCSLSHLSWTLLGGNNSNSANYNWSKVSHINITFPWGFLLIQSHYSHNSLLSLVKPQQQLVVLELWGEEGRVQPGRYPFSNHFKHQFNANHPAWVLSNGQRGGRRRWQLSHSDAPK